MLNIIVRLITESWLVLGQMAPYLLLGFLVAGVLSVYMSPAWIERHLGRRGWRPVVAASIFGVPLPLCSCGVIPVSASLHRHGASRAATTAFLLSTPQTGVDSIAVTYALLGPVFAIFRPIVALLTGVFGGLLVQLAGEQPRRVYEAGEREPDTCAEDCCSGAARKPGYVRALQYGFITLPRDIGLALVVGVLIAGGMSVAVPQGQLHAYLGGGIVSILLLMAAGVPLYVCATASVPIAAGFLHMGASPGAVLAFLIAGPATNAAAVSTMWKVLGRRTAVLYLLAVSASAIISGLILNWLVPVVGTALPQLGEHVHETMSDSWGPHVAAAALVIVLATSLCMKPDQSQQPAVSEEDEAKRQGREKLELVVGGMNCSHCAESVTRSLAETSGVTSADVDLVRGRAVVFGNHLDGQELISTVQALGYSAHVVET